MNLEKIIYNSLPVILIILIFTCVLRLCSYYNKYFGTENENENEIKIKYLLKESELSKAFIL